MKQLIQSYKTGELGIFDVPPPVCDGNGVLVRTAVSLVSAGTEKMIVDMAKKSLVGKAKARPDLVRQVLAKMRQEGVRTTLEKVFSKLDTPIPLGYSSAGKVIEVGGNVDGISLGDRVACGGAGYASHGQISYIPKNLFVKIPDGVSDVDASFVTVGAIALQGVRQASPTLGEYVAVIGLGLIGQLTVQILKANGCNVIGVDLDTRKCSLAKELGADIVAQHEDLVRAAHDFSFGRGVDSVIITASTSSDQPIADAGEIARAKGKVVVVGMVGMNIPRNIYYKKELDLRLSMAYGPGRYDPQYEEQGMDYPYAYVRWTEQRNFAAFLNLIADGKVTPSKLVTHNFSFQDALKAYDLLEGKVNEKYLGITLTYDQESDEPVRKIIRLNDRVLSHGEVSVGLIGAGNFSKSVLLPTLFKVGGFAPIGVCTATGVSAHTTGRKYGFKYMTTDAHELMGNSEVNTVFITTRHNTHAGYILEALKAGKHVFVEKPLCLNEEELDEIESIYSSLLTPHSRPILTVGFNRRFSPFIQEMKNNLDGSPISLIYRVNAGMIPKDHWIQDKNIGGGRIVGEVCHFIDTCSYLVNSLPVSVFATSIKGNDQSIPNEDNISIVLNFETGSTATIHYSAYGNKQIPKEYIEVFGNSIAMQMNDFRDLIIFKGNKKKRIKSRGQDKGFYNELLAFRDGIKKGVWPIPFESLICISRTVFKVQESLRNRSRVAIS